MGRTGLLWCPQKRLYAYSFWVWFLDRPPPEHELAPRHDFLRRRFHPSHAKEVKFNERCCDAVLFDGEVHKLPLVFHFFKSHVPNFILLLHLRHPQLAEVDASPLQNVSNDFCAGGFLWFHSNKKCIILWSAYLIPPRYVFCDHLHQSLEVLYYLIWHRSTLVQILLLDEYERESEFVQGFEEPDKYLGLAVEGVFQPDQNIIATGD